MGYGAQLRKARIRANLTQLELAELIHISESNVSRIENDKIRASLEIVADWSKATNTEFYITEYGLKIL